MKNNDINIDQYFATARSMPLSVPLIKVQNLVGNAAAAPIKPMYKSWLNYMNLLIVAGIALALTAGLLLHSNNNEPVEHEASIPPIEKEKETTKKVTEETQPTEVKEVFVTEKAVIESVEITTPKKQVAEQLPLETPPVVIKEKEPVVVTTTKTENLQETKAPEYRAKPVRKRTFIVTPATTDQELARIQRLALQEGVAISFPKVKRKKNVLSRIFVKLNCYTNTNATSCGSFKIMTAEGLPMDTLRFGWEYDNAGLISTFYARGKDYINRCPGGMIRLKSNEVDKAPEAVEQPDETDHADGRDGSDRPDHTDLLDKTDRKVKGAKKSDKSTDKAEFVVTENTTKSELAEIEKEAKLEGVNLKFAQVKFDENKLVYPGIKIGHSYEIKGKNTSEVDNKRPKRYRESGSIQCSNVPDEKDIKANPTFQLRFGWEKDGRGIVSRIYVYSGDELVSECSR
jgi:hypothetical protein